MQELKIPNGYYHLWQTYLNVQGLEILSLPFLPEEQLKLKQVLNQAIDAQSSYGFFMQIIEKTKKELDCPHLAFEMAQHVRAEHFGVLGYMATRSNSIAEALQYILRFSRLVIDGDEIKPMQMLQTGQNIHLFWPFLHEKYCFINELTNALMVHLARKMMPLELFPLLCVNFAHAPQMAIYHYQKFYACEVNFNQPEYSFVLSLNALNLKIEDADPSLTQLLVRQAEEAIASKARFDNIVQYCHQWIADDLRQHEHAPKIEDLAIHLNISVRTLQRQLSNLDCSFKKILEVERMKRCEQLLLDNVNLTEIAMRLGYSDQSALARAYKAFSGQTLLQKKQQLKE
ncbi:MULTISPECIES: AraC family transcriptional regulator [Acinetobacter]|uniref:AraC family transcriptional regulator n=1 Tax=Acinetobacter piscicola TaxID=2006115 RepID=A0A7S6VYB8_9GAMM|nr:MULTISPECIES: AraC family transcriptional regulator [Acinetobacter]QOW47118.1 AraC family transcriptional regulator [Acinetobacter piscicola]